MVAGRGGALLGGTAPVAFTHGTGQVDSDIVVEWDLDGDGDYSEPEEDVTGYLLSARSLTGRDFPSQLTGRSGPGKLTVELLNTDGRFGYFNTASPLNQAPFAVRTGSKIRVRAAEAANPDPVLLARDRFRGQGALGSDELGNTWDQAAGTFTRQADSEGRTLVALDIKTSAAPSYAVVDLGTADYYAQVHIRHADHANSVGMIYRLDGAGHGLVYIRENTLYLAEVTTMATVVDSVAVERRNDMTLGVHLDGTTITVHLEGVPVISNVAYASSSGQVGLYGVWREQRAPSWSEFYAWDALNLDPAEGILGTGRVTAITPRAPVDGPPTVTVTAEGPLLDAARAEVPPPASLGPSSVRTGTPTGMLVGATLAAAQLLHPPGPIDEGDVLPGPVGLPRGNALDMARLFEEVEIGFLFETQEGRVGFQSRGARTAGPPDVVFSDAAGAQFGYRSLELGDWRREVINRVTARLAPQLPGLHAFYGVQQDQPLGVDTSITLPLPDGTNGTEPGDLFLVFMASTVSASGQEWESPPPGWKEYRPLRDTTGKLRIYAKVLEAGDLGATVTFYDDSSTLSGGAWIVGGGTIKHWYGDLDQGVLVTDSSTYGPPNSADEAAAGINTPPVAFPSWGPAASLFWSIRSGMVSLSGATVEAPTDDTAPHGYGNTIGGAITSPAKAGAEVALQYAVRDAAVEVESPSPWAAGADVFEGFLYGETVTIAVRGFAGDPPEVAGGQVVQVDDTASQDRHGAILPHHNPAELFASETDATAYAEAVLVRYGTERPILTLSFAATTTAAYRAQALRRRVGDRVRLEATGAANLGIAGDFYIEAISHRWERAGKLWETTWELSPA